MKTQLSQSKKGLVLAASAAALAMVSGLAQAGPVTTWGYSTETKFDLVGSPPTWEASGTGTQIKTASELSWGKSGGNFKVNTGDSDQNRSALTVGQGTLGNTRTGGGAVTGSIDTTVGGTPNIGLNQIKKGNSFTHWNNPLSSDFITLMGGTVLDTLTLTPTLPTEYIGYPSIGAPTIAFDFKFQETPNAGSGGSCAGGRAIPTDGCEDLFGFGVTSLNNAFQYADSGADNIFGTGDDFLRTYYASVFVLDGSGNAFPISQLLEGECTALGLDDGCQGFRTSEKKTTTVQFAFAVTTEKITIPGNDVPEPGTLALFGIALAGLVGMRRRKQS